MQKKYLTTLAMATIALSPLFVMKAASLTDLSQNYPPVLPRVELDLDAESETEAELDTPATDVETNIDADVSIDNENEDDSASVSGSMMTVTREDAEAETSANIDMRVEDVITEADLRTFAIVSVRGDERVDSISFESDSVEVSYSVTGRFVGILPVDVSVEVEVDQEGDIDFDYPWYGFLVDKDKENLEALVEAEVEAVFASEAPDGWTNYDRARLAGSIVAALKAHYDSTEDAPAGSEV